jgi:GNAT superfamily N-acetyltransferase
MGSDLRHVCDVNYWLASAAFFGTSRRGGVTESHDLLLWHCGFPQTDFNVAFPKRPDADLDVSLATAERHFESVGLPYTVEFRAEGLVRCDPPLRRAGFEPVGETPAMVLIDPRPPPASASGLEVVPVAGPEDLADFQRTSFLGFGLPERAGALFLTEQLLALPGVTLYLGRVDGEPVCTSALVQTGEVAGIYWVATLPDFRGRGLGAAITWAAVQGGVDRGCRVASLQASAMGAPVYIRMGFDTPTHYVKYQQPAS